MEPRSMYHIRVLYGSRKPLSILMGCADWLNKFAQYCAESAVTIESVGLVTMDVSNDILNGRTATDRRNVDNLMSSFSKWDYANGN